jgi:hypothetical protein
MMLASGTWSVRTLLMGRTISELGAMPGAHHGSPHADLRWHTRNLSGKDCWAF